VEQEGMGLDHKARYYIDVWDVDNTWDVWQDNGKLTFPSHIANCDTLGQAKLVRDALESFPKELEDYL
jgi:hypothetical protein